MERILLNATIIWALSLLIYQLVLNKLTFHSLNRYYLLLTFLLGILLPLLPWEQPADIIIAKPALNSTPLTSITTVAQASSPSALPYSEPQVSGLNGWLLLYLLGVAVALAYMLRDTVQLWVLYRRSKLTRDGRWIAAETGRDHTPFSFLNIIFVGSLEDYSDQQWQMIRDHEQLHYRSRHFLDIALLQLAITLLWFHPLVYIYRYKLRLLHEYEVDSRRNCDLKTYGNFLLELVADTPSHLLAHSFVFSPLKQRISMMTAKTSPPRNLYRFLIILPLMSCFIWCCIRKKPSVVVDVKGRFAMRHDVNFGYPPNSGADTLIMKGSNGKPDTIITISELLNPTKLNGKDIVQQPQNGPPPLCINPGSEFGINYLLGHSGADKILTKMLDGEYYMEISNILIDPSGHVDYYMITFPENRKEFRTAASGLTVLKPSGLTEAEKDTIQRKISAFLLGGSVAFKPAKSTEGTAEPFFLAFDGGHTPYKLGTTITVKNHQISYTD